jgi:hypothetical protein
MVRCTDSKMTLLYVTKFGINVHSNKPLHNQHARTRQRVNATACERDSV